MFFEIQLCVIIDYKQKKLTNFFVGVNKAHKDEVTKEQSHS